MNSLVAAIPVRNSLEWTRSLVSFLLDGDEVDEVWLFDNGSSDGTSEWAASLAAVDLRLKVSTRPQAWLYGMWNEMVSRASARPGTVLALLNNDIRLPTGGLRQMYLAMEGYEMAFIDADRDPSDPLQAKPVAADWWDRTGWAFMLRADFWRGQPFAVDPGLRLWWGDDDLARRAQARGGRLCRMQGVGCFHAESQSEYPGDRRAAIEHDRSYFRRIWNDE